MLSLEIIHFGAEFASEHHEISASVIKKAFLATEEEFLSQVRQQWLIKPQLASVGSCCLTGIICNGLVYIANVGDSRAVLGRVEKGVRGVAAIQLSTEHNASIDSVRDELRSLHPDDPQIVVLKHKVWRVKGLIQVFHLRFHHPGFPLALFFSNELRSLLNTWSAETIQLQVFHNLMHFFGSFCL